MAKMKKKMQKQKHPTRLRVLVASLMALSAPLSQSANTEFSDYPLVGVAETFAPHIALALSVEFPTAGAAYTTTSIFAVDESAADGTVGTQTASYKGYFDNTKCYKYNFGSSDTEGYFYPSSNAKIEGNNKGLCNNDGETEEFSGNLMNFMTMSAIDIFRGAMTGGNRAVGSDTKEDNYSKADEKDKTYVRRARVLEGTNGAAGYYLGDRAINMQNLSAYQQSIMKRLLPHAYTTVMMKNVISGEDLGSNERELEVKNYASSSNNPFGRPKKEGYYAVTEAIATKPIIDPTGQKSTANTPTQVHQYPNAIASDYDRFSDGYLRFFNNNFKVTLARRINSVYVDNQKYMDNAALYSNIPTNALMRGRASNGGDGNAYKVQYYGVYKPTTAVSGWDNKWATSFNVVVKTCVKDTAKGLLPEDHCVEYSGNYKPEGLMQQYTRSNGMRFATLGYLYNGMSNGGVLRSKMKKLIGDPNGNFQDEWDQTTGIANLNPDKNDASQANATYSGAINYLNKFGDFNGYKSYDPAGELYYTTLAYLTGTNIQTDNSAGNGTGPAAYSSDITPLISGTDGAKVQDYFPVYTTWDDPYKRGVASNVWHCHKSSIIFIGDTFTHRDGDVPGNGGSGGGWGVDGNVPTDKYLTGGILGNDLTQRYLQRILTDSGNPFTLKANVGSGISPASISALAYWARVNDIRPDIDGVQNGDNFIVDVLEQGNYRTAGNNMQNAYYLAAKYGGFTRANNKNDTATATTYAEKYNDVDNKELPITGSWEGDEAQNLAGFKGVTGGGDTPKNYAIANNPDNMVNALKRAMDKSGTLNNPSQAATGISVSADEVMDFTGGKKPMTLQSTYNFEKLTGDVVAYETKYVGTQKDSNEILQTTAKWYANKYLTDTYHNATSYGSRKAFAGSQSGTIYPLNATSAASIFSGVSKMNGFSASDLANYALGDTSNEGDGKTMRERSGLMGTVVNSTVKAITPVKANVNQSTKVKCSYADLNAAKNRGTYYAAASNNGFLHIFNIAQTPTGKTESDGTLEYTYSGTETMAYMPSTAVEKLPEFASPSFLHQYLNDGTASVHEMCFGDVAKSVVVGTAGRGGRSLYALDVTDLSNPSKSNVLWEFSKFSDPDLSHTVSSPVMSHIIDENGKLVPIAIVSSGYNNSKASDKGSAPSDGHLFILRLDNTSGSWRENTNYWKIKLGEAGVGAPFAYDGDSDGIVDQIFVGDVSGKVWQIKRVGDGGTGTPVTWNKPYGDAPLFTSPDNRPINGAPYADLVNGKLMVVVATGQYFSEADLSTTQQNYAYGLIVDESRGVVSNSALLNQEINTTKVTSGVDVASNVNLYTVTNNQMTDAHQGWRLKLLVGQNVAADALIRKKQVAEFTAVRLTDEVSSTCQRAGSTSYISVDVTNGGLYSKPVFDTNRDGQHDSSDVAVGVYEINGMVTSQSTLMTIRTPDGTLKNLVRGTDGGSTADVDLNKLNQSAGVRRISWREIF